VEHGGRGAHYGARLSALPSWALVALGSLIVVQLTLEIIALIDLYRRPVQLLMFGNKWIWVAIVILVNTLGAILYLLVGRKGAPLPGERSPAAKMSASAGFLGPNGPGKTTMLRPHHRASTPNQWRRRDFRTSQWPRRLPTTQPLRENWSRHGPTSNGSPFSRTETGSHGICTTT
jgi:Phospholipase_D-nuclease N-terminal